MANRKPPRFKSEVQEAEWWAKNQDFIADRFEEAKAACKLGKGTVARLARQRVRQSVPSPTITIRLAETDLARARTLASQRGLRYQTYLKMLLRQALDSEENCMSKIDQPPEPEMVKRHPYKGFTIKVSVYKLANGRYTALGNIEKGTSSVGFDTGRELLTKEAALEAGLQAGQRRIGKGFDVGPQ